MFILLTFTHTCECVTAHALSSQWLIWVYQDHDFARKCSFICVCYAAISVLCMYRFAHFRFIAQINRWQSGCMHFFRDHYIIQHYRSCTNLKKIRSLRPFPWYCSDIFHVGKKKESGKQSNFRKRILFLALTNPSSQGPAHTEMNASTPAKKNYVWTFFPFFSP